jgi:hypothetical protein
VRANFIPVFAGDGCGSREFHVATPHGFS